jgi:cell division protein FtsI/penicillin-binding protein 2
MRRSGGKVGLRPTRAIHTPIQLEATGSRWRRDQKLRRSHLTARGRLTLTGIVTVLMAPIAWWVAPPLSWSSGFAPAAGSEIVSEPAPDVALEQRVPTAVLERLPVTSAVLDLRPAGTESEVPGRLVERVAFGVGQAPVDVEYTLDADLTKHVFRVLERGRVALGNVVLMDPNSGRVLAYASTDVDQFPPTRHYPAASLVKVITAAAALESAPEKARLPCRFRGSPYRLTPKRLDPPEVGNVVSLQRALATSNNQCFAQLAVHALGSGTLLAAIERFGWLAVPAPAHASGRADPGEERYDIGRLGSGLAGAHITPLHAVQLAAALAEGELVAPRWVERVLAVDGRELELPAQPAPRRILSLELTRELRRMLVDTTRSGTARRAFRKKSGQPLLGDVRVAGKTGSLDGKNPDGRYEWFIGVAPADDPKIAVATVLVQDHLWWRNASQVAAEVLRGVFCEGKRCDAENATRFVRRPAEAPPLARRLRPQPSA